MIVEIITIGREILDGRVVDTNSVRIAELLKPHGLVPRFGQRVDDDISRIVDAFEIAARRSELILVTGGLGPTSDDLTAEAFGAFLKTPLEINKEALEQVEVFFKRVNLTMIDTQKKQALLPRECFILANTEGTAPGFGLKRDRQLWFFMPGVPREMEAMLKNEVLPRIPSKTSPLSKTWVTQFTSEGKLQELLTPIEKKLPRGFEVTYRTRFPENHIGLYAPDKSNERDFQTLAQEITNILGATVFTTASQSEEPGSLERVVYNALKETKTVMASIESCTGGLISKRITSISGSSEVFWGAVVSYDNAAKAEILDVPESLIDSVGAVSEEVARAMAEGGLKRMQASIEKHRSSTVKDRTGLVCVSTTGVAGPNGGSDQKPVGLCYIGLASTTRATKVIRVQGRINYDRERNQLWFSQQALEAVRQLLMDIRIKSSESERA